MAPSTRPLQPHLSSKPSTQPGAMRSITWLQAQACFGPAWSALPVYKPQHSSLQQTIYCFLNIIVCKLTRARIESRSTTLPRDTIARTYYQANHLDADNDRRGHLFGLATKGLHTLSLVGTTTGPACRRGEPADFSYAGGLLHGVLCFWRRCGQPLAQCGAQKSSCYSIMHLRTAISHQCLFIFSLSDSDRQ